MLFQALKGRGFELEQTRLIRYARIKKVIALLAIAFCWAHKTGQWKHQVVKPLRIKSHGRWEQSWFRYGLDELTDTLLHGASTPQQILRLLMLLFWPPDRLQQTKSIDYFAA